MNQMLNTLGYKLSDHDKNLIFDNFDYLYKMMRDEGHIKEEVFNDLGFPLDHTSNGEIIHRNYEISMEWCQRSKIISSVVQRQLRNNRFVALREKEKEKEAAALQSRTKKIEMSEIAERQIINEHNRIKRAQFECNHEQANNDSSDNVYMEVTSVSDCCIESFAKPLGSNLQEFIRIRMFNSIRVPRSAQWKWPAKMKVTDAQNGTRCLILLAYNLRANNITPIFQ